MPETAHELVARGAALLDAKLPGWADQIDLESLEMADACKCVLGQIGSEQVNLDRLGWHPRRVRDDAYGKALHALGIHMKDDAYGFEIDDPDEDGVHYEDLADAWKGEIVARRTLDAR